MKVKAIIRCNKYGFKSCFGLGGVVLKTLDYSKPAAWQTLCFCNQTLIYQKAQLLALSSTVIQLSWEHVCDILTVCVKLLVFKVLLEIYRI